MPRNGDTRTYKGKKQVYVASVDKWFNLEETAPVVPKVAVPPSTGSNVKNPLAFSKETERKLMQEALDVDTPTQTKIRIIMDSMKDLLLYKNKKYGDSAINPKKIFYKGDSTNSILIRLDDKLGRVMSNTE